MFPKLQKKLVFLYTLSTGLILTLILAAAFLLYVSSQENRQKSLFQDQLFTLTSKLQTDSIFTDSYLTQMEIKSQLLIYLEENSEPFFFPGSYVPRTDRNTLFSYAERKAEEEGIYPDSHPISSNLLQSSVFRIQGEKQDSYLGNVLVFQSPSGYKKLILLQDVSNHKIQILKTGILYLFIDFLGILLLYFTGRWFVRRSLKPLGEAYQKQQDFVAAASHELRSPLTVIRTTADAIADAPSESGRLLQIIKSECQRGSALVKNLLLLASLDQKSWAVRSQTFELDELLLNLLELYEPLFHAKGGTLLLELPVQTLPPVQADPNLCRQIFTILLDNAVAYGLEGNAKKVSLRAEPSNAHVIVRIIDHGPGISDAEKQLIFDRFYRSDQSRNKKEHFGLGLSIAAQLADLQGIGLEVLDTEGGGSTFVVRI